MNATIRAEGALMRALRWREALLPPETDAFRVVDGEADGFPGVSVDAFAGHWWVQSSGLRLPPGFEEAAASHCQSLWWKVREAPAGLAPVQHLRGSEPDQPFLAREEGLRFVIDFRAGSSPGVFLDQRLNRHAVRARVRTGDQVLNCFAYTCGFSVAAALGGSVTTSLDLSPRCLDWGRANFEANDLVPEDHFFCRGDVMTWLTRWGKQQRRFAGVILDPPTFSRAGKGRGIFRVEKDFGSLAAKALEVTEPGGWLLCCTNDRGLPARRFLALIQTACADRGRTARFRMETMPPEFRGEPYLKTVWVDLAADG
ncbi:MAG TPA: class I SAM-dependent methyltransferase [Verrucomicrobiales bacterium]|nr:class I SAM-dependent methyltransferase [Verrucomicrobiales bacterium]